MPDQIEVNWSNRSPTGKATLFVDLMIAGANETQLMAISEAAALSGMLRRDPLASEPVTPDAEYMTFISKDSTIGPKSAFRRRLKVTDWIDLTEY